MSDLTNDEWVEQELKALRKYTTEFEENVCDSHLPQIQDYVRDILFSNADDDELVTSNQALLLECVAEYGIRYLVDYMIFDRKSSDEVKLFTIGSIRTKLAEVRARVDSVLDRAEMELLGKEKQDE